ncbi:MAG TPA: 2-succinyl-5-enolpyruvyl-6-hydroxy-3-cyclohexene-1-carboxylic-acid synthase [Chloroflexia bacterium]|nr:2-succinyl-5-enolpyruvyl-6-hydroxy-3-cyclohexene-1-carboxylic-acid synthase [Chloroflexia bacterium]
MNPQAVLFAYTSAFVDELARAGIQHVCICPGSRSTPLALLIARHPGLRVWMHVDERSAAFFALGMAKARREPVALVCTSGTAAANFFPAVIEAHLAHVPLLVLTADRPAELRDNGAPQAIDQVRLYGPYAKWFADLALPEATPAMLRYVRTMAARAVATTRTTPAGPVHLNLPFREPLVPLADETNFPNPLPPSLQGRGSDEQGNSPPRRGEGPGERKAPPDSPPRAGEGPGERSVAVVEGPRVLPAGAVPQLLGMLAGRRGLILCGPQDDPALAPAVLALAGALDYPVLADPLSGVRCGPHHGPLVLDSYDAFLRDADFVAGHAPEVVVRFGAMPTSKPVLLYLQQYPACHLIVVDGGAGWNEPTQLAGTMIYADPVALCTALVAAAQTSSGPDGSGAAAPPDWCAGWVTAHRRTREVLARKLDAMDAFFEGKIFAELAALLPAGATLYAGNSMPVRDLDTFFPGGERPLRFLCNRGANGIDGVVSSALGASTTGAPLLLVIGDLSFYHDLNGLLAAKQHRLHATIVLLNNDGGGIFSFLPQASAADHFEQLFGTPTGLDFRPAVEMYGGRFVRPATWDAFRAAVRTGLAGDGLTVIEIRTDRQENVAAHRGLWPAVAETKS